MGKTQESMVSRPWAQSCEEVLEKLSVDAERGLSDKEAAKRRKEYGANRLREVEEKSVWEILLNQFKSLIIALLAAASVLSFIFTGWVEGTAVAVAIILNTVIGFFMELKAVRSMEALRQMERVTAKVLRGGKISEIHAAELVDGDIVVFEAGDIASADMRLVEASKLQADESMLTGESVPVTKDVSPVDEEAAVADRANMLFKGTAVTRGSGKAAVTATGMRTELGRISSLIEEAEDEFTPLEKRLGQFGRKLLWVTLGVLVVVAVMGIIRGKEMLLMIETAIALAVAAVPEGLPIVATIAMARGMLRMARRNALVNRLAAVETLGGTSVICTDKTGTLTENEMTVTSIVLESGGIEVRQEDDQIEFVRGGETVESEEGSILWEALMIGVLCNNASFEERDGAAAVGDPMEVALLTAGAKAGVDRGALLEKWPEEREEAFDPSRKMMATFHKRDEKYFAAVKGAPEEVVKVCAKVRGEEGDEELDEDGRRSWMERNESLAGEGQRILAVACKEVGDQGAEPYDGLTLVGLVGMLDPPREDVKDAIGLCRKAGLQVVMVTGDHALTALNIAERIGLVEDEQAEAVMGSEIKPYEELSEEQRRRFLEARVFARVSPEQKLNLVDIHQRSGAIAAMTGDGVNDAPGLRKADIGIAMGGRGTQVAREASDMVLKDDSFSTIVVAIEQGRIIFDNIRKFIVYLLSGNAAEIMIVFIASILDMPLPLLPLQILLLNIISDVFPALALGLGEGSGDVMERPPRDPKEPVLTGGHWFAIFGYGLLIAVPVLGAFALSLYWMGMGRVEAVTVSFLTLAFARLWHILNMRGRRTSVLDNDIVKNRYVWAAIAICTALLLGVVYLPVISAVLKLTGPGLAMWGVIAAVSLVPTILGQALKAVSGRKA